MGSEALNRGQVCRGGHDAGVNDIEMEVLPDPAALAGRAADLVSARLAAAIEARGLATLAVSGGSTPKAFLAELAERKLPWDRLHLFQVDERVAPLGPERNLTGLQEALLERVPIPAGNVHSMPVDEADLQAAARVYGNELPPRLDVVHLGVGDDGHTASWPPGDPVVDATDDVAVVGPFNGRLRMTLTPPAVNRAGWIVWLIAGQSKAPAVGGLLAGDPALPASRVRRHDVTLLADTAAAGNQ